MRFPLRPIPAGDDSRRAGKRWRHTHRLDGAQHARMGHQHHLELVTKELEEQQGAEPFAGALAGRRARRLAQGLLQVSGSVDVERRLHVIAAHGGIVQAEVVLDVVGEKGQHELAAQPVSPRLQFLHQAIFLAGAVTRHPDVHDFERLARTRLQPGADRVVLIERRAEDERITQQHDPLHSRLGLARERPVAQAELVDADVHAARRLGVEVRVVARLQCPAAPLVVSFHRDAPLRRQRAVSPAQSHLAGRQQQRDADERGREDERRVGEEILARHHEVAGCNRVLERASNRIQSAYVNFAVLRTPQPGRSEPVWW